MWVIQPRAHLTSHLNLQMVTFSKLKGFSEAATNAKSHSASAGCFLVCVFLPPRLNRLDPNENLKCAFNEYVCWENKVQRGNYIQESGKNTKAQNQRKPESSAGSQRTDNQQKT